MAQVKLYRYKIEGGPDQITVTQDKDLQREMDNFFNDSMQVISTKNGVKNLKKNPLEFIEEKREEK